MGAMKRLGGLQVLALLLGMCWWNGCSEVHEENALPSGPVAKVHEDGWANLQTGQFLHAEEIANNKGNTTSCQRCHGTDLQGKGDPQRSCFQCHSDPAKGVIHPAGWADLATGQFQHAAQIRQNGGNTASCQGCHGEKYDGGIAQSSCLSCHADPAKGVIHPAGWADLATGQFLHAASVRQNGGSTASCQGCHGQDYAGGIAQSSCLSCHADPAKGVIHPAGWADLQTGQFLHAASVRQSGGSTANCQGCHGQDYAGGIAQSSCLSCHTDPGSGLIHPADWLNPSAKENFHGEAIRAGNWDMSGCQGCHGADYAGGIVAVSCLTCHAGTPESCTTCHGGSGGIAPPEDTRGNRETTFYGVGAHQAHLSGTSLSAVMNCGDCHQFPAGFADPAHIDGDGRAELVFGARASANGSVPAYDAQANTCAGTYCHSGGRMGNQHVPVWTEVGTGQAACGTCHSLPPGEATGHTQVALTCSVCHSQVVDAENNIINSDLHLNGQTDF